MIAKDVALARVDSVACLDTLRASDTTTAVVKLSLRRYNSKASLPPDFEGFFAQEFKSRFQIPANLPLSVVMLFRARCVSKTDCTGAGLWLSASGYAVARKNGTLAFIGVADESLTPEFAGMVRSVLEGMSQERLVPQIREDSLPLQIAVRLEHNPDTIPRERQLFRVRVPWYDLRFTAPEAPPKQTVPYPRNAERAGIEDSVSLSFTIMQDGSVHPLSLDLRSGVYREFIREVATSLEKSTYTPARLGACPVATWTSQSFVFRAPRF